MDPSSDFSTSDSVSVSEALRLAALNEEEATPESFLEAMTAIVALPHITHHKLFRTVVDKVREYPEVCKETEIIDGLLNVLDDVELPENESTEIMAFLLGLS